MRSILPLSPTEWSLTLTFSGVLLFTKDHDNAHHLLHVEPTLFGDSELPAVLAHISKNMCVLVSCAASLD